MVGQTQQRYTTNGELGAFVGGGFLLLTIFRVRLGLGEYSTPPWVGYRVLLVQGNVS
jgi:hypothetical protein